MDFNHCKDGKAPLVRQEGRVSRGRCAKKGHITKRSKVGYGPCRTSPTHIAEPSPYEVGAFDYLEAGQMALWAEFGPRGGRRSAASSYAEPYGYLPPGRDWAARSFQLPTPPALPPRRPDIASPSA